MFHTGRIKPLFGILLFLSVLCLCFAVSAAESGTCGDNLTWSLNDDGALTISGTGAMTDYEFYLNNPAPWGTGVRSVVINNGVTSIGSCAFTNCTDLTNVTIPDSITGIGTMAFYYCSSLTGITIPDSVTSIGRSAFSGCTALSSARLPSSLSTIEGELFSGCEKLADITIPKTVTTIGSAAFQYCLSLKNVVIPDSVTIIEGNAFYHCTNLESVKTPKYVTQIGRYAFEFCSSLTSFTVPDGVTAIPDYTFDGCSKLSSITLPKSVKRIDYCAFCDCDGLKDVYYAGSASDSALINYDEYNTCLTRAYWHYNSANPDPEPEPEPELTSVTVAGGKYELDAKKKNAIFTGPEKKSAKTLVVQDKVTIGGKSYKVTEIAAGACKGMSKLTTLTVGKNVKTIGKEAFYKCQKAKTIKIPGTALKKVGANAFGGGASKVTVYCAKKKIKAYTKLLQNAGLSKKSVFKELK